MSKSVANSLQVLIEIGTSGFEDALATAEFLECFDTCFDMMNSKFAFFHGSKAPISINNEAEWKSNIKNCREYIFGLKMLDGKSVLDSKRKAAFIGWISNFKVIEEMYNMYVCPGHIPDVKTYKMGQDPLEIFFGSLRASLGFNNNPTVSQFAGAYRKNCSGALLKSGEGANCLWEESVVSLQLDTEEAGMVDSDPGAVYITALESPLNNELRGDILTYVSGNVQRTVASKLTWCNNCFLYLSLDDGETNTSCSLIRHKDFGGLVKPLKDVCDLVNIVDWVVEHNAKCSNFLSIPKVKDKLAVSSLQIVSEKNSNSFNNMCEDPSHKVIVLKMLIKAYLHIKLGHICRKKTESMKTFKRHIHKKMPIFNHE